MARFTENEHFKTFSSSLGNLINKHQIPEKEALLRQKNQVETLVKLEKKFRNVLINHSFGNKIYKSFIKMICNERKNILAARPYFRERQETFTSSISKALKHRNFKRLKKFHFNYNFILFVLKQYNWGPNSKLIKLFKQIQGLRKEIVLMNLPLAISRAKIFWSKTPKSQLSYMDLIQISTEGLISAIDKFCLPFSRVFRAVAIGRMLGNFIENYSETLIHFYPLDKRRIYRANKLVHKYTDGVNYEELAQLVNKDIEYQYHTNASELSDLMSASSTVSIDSVPNNLNNPQEVLEPAEKYQDDPAKQPDQIAEKIDSFKKLYEACEKLTLFEKKMLVLIGMSDIKL